MVSDDQPPFYMTPGQAYPGLTVEMVVEDARWLENLPEVHELSEFCLQQAWMAVLVDKMAKDAFPVEISLYLASDESIQKLNVEYRHKNKPTNVLSFPMFEGWGAMVAMASQVPEVPLGDIVIARETILREAVEQNKGVKEHFIHMLVHSLLHLCGYDHEDEDEAENMEALETMVLGGLGIANPYV